MKIYIISINKNTQELIKSYGLDSKIYTYEESMKLIYYSTYYIGGNTGLTHMAAHSPYIKRMIEISTDQHKLDKKLTENIVHFNFLKKHVPPNKLEEFGHKTRTRCLGTNNNIITVGEELCLKNKIITKFFK